MSWLLLLADFFYPLISHAFVGLVPAILLLLRFFQNSAPSEDFSQLKNTL
jgi:hypothetical protein